MNRYPENTVIIGQGIYLNLDEILRLEIELIELGRMFETDKLEYDNNKLVIKYGNKQEELEEKIPEDLVDESNLMEASTSRTPVHTPTQPVASNAPSDSRTYGRTIYSTSGNLLEINIVTIKMIEIKVNIDLEEKECL